MLISSAEANLMQSYDYEVQELGLIGVWGIWTYKTIDQVSEIG